MAGVETSRGQLKDTRRALFRTPNQDDNSKAPGEEMFPLSASLNSPHFLVSKFLPNSNL